MEGYYENNPVNGIVSTLVVLLVLLALLLLLLASAPLATVHILFRFFIYEYLNTYSTFL